MMEYPKIASAKAIDDRTLLIEFNNKQKRKYDITPLLEIAMFEPLKDTNLFKTVQVEAGGYAIVWNNSIDISEYELWRHGQLLV